MYEAEVRTGTVATFKKTRVEDLNAGASGNVPVCVNHHMLVPANEGMAVAGAGVGPRTLAGC